MTNVLITIETPSGPMDLSVPARVTITELLAILAPVVESHPVEWALTDPHGVPLDPAATIEDTQILDGTRLTLAPANAGPPVDDTPPAVRISPVDRAARVIPDRSSTRERVAITARALLASHSPAGAGGLIDRGARAWRWTDHERRLEWLLSRPKLRRTVFIGVTGHRHDDVAGSLADALTANRRDRVVLVDASTSAAVTRRLLHSGSGFAAIESCLQRGDVPGVERDLLFGRTRHGTLVVPRDLTRARPDGSTMERLSDSLATHARLVVNDCGPSTDPTRSMIDRCDQVVLSTTGPTPRFSAQTIVAVWGEGPLPRDGDHMATCRVADSPESMLELALVVASGWADLGAGTPVPLGL